MGYDHTLYDHIPEGWRKAFGKQLSKELKKQLKKDNQLKTFRFSQIKEKYGTLRLYTFGCSKAVQNILDKYEELSEEYCIYCGKKSKYKTEGYILYVCEDCLYKYFPNLVKNVDAHYYIIKKVDYLNWEDVCQEFKFDPINWCKKYIKEKYKDDYEFDYFSYDYESDVVEIFSEKK